MATIITKNSSTASSVPTNAQLVQGELAVNVTDKRLFTENASGTVVELGTNPSSLTLPNGTANGVAYLNGSKVLTTGSALVFDGSNLGLGVTPSAWGSGLSAFDINGRGGLAYLASAGQFLALSNNVYYNAGYKYKATAGAGQMNIGSDGSFAWFTAPSGTAGAAISFTQAMTLDSSGNLLVGRNSQLSTERFAVLSPNNWGMSVEVSQNANGNIAQYSAMGTNTNNTTSYFLQCVTSGVGAKFYIYGNGTYGTVSDANLKKNIETARDGYLADLMRLRVVKYNWKTDVDGTPKELGWIAQELAEVFPGMVQDSQPDADGKTIKEVKSSVLPFMLLKAIQELKAEFDAYKAAHP